MAVTLRLTNDWHRALRATADVEGVSMHEIVRHALHAYFGREDRRVRVIAATRRVMSTHADALDRLGH